MDTPVIVQLFHVVAPAKVWLPVILRVLPVAVTVPAVRVKVVTVQVIAPAKVIPPVLFIVIAVPEIVPPVKVTAEEPASVVVPALQFTPVNADVFIVVVPAVVRVSDKLQAELRVIVNPLPIVILFQVIPLVARVVAKVKDKVEEVFTIVPAV